MSTSNPEPAFIKQRRAALALQEATAQLEVPAAAPSTNPGASSGFRPRPAFLGRHYAVDNTTEGRSDLQAEAGRIAEECLEEDYEQLAQYGWKGGDAWTYALFWLEGTAGDECGGDDELSDAVMDLLRDGFRPAVHNPSVGGE